MNHVSISNAIPRDESAEAAVLGAAMISRAAVGEALVGLDPRDFYVPKNEAVFEAIHALSARMEPVDVIKVTDELLARGELRQVGGPEYLHWLVDQVPSAVAAGHYVEIVRERASLRRLFEAGQEIQRAALDTHEADAALERARGMLDGVSSSNVLDRGWIGDSLPSLFAKLAEGQQNYLSTGWQMIDHLIGGLRPGALYVMGARPGVGKTAIAMNLAAEVAKGGGVVGFASLEMGEEELQARLLSSVGSIHMGGLLDGTMSAVDWQKAEMAAPVVNGMKMRVLDDAASLSSVLAFARALDREHGLSLLVVDYLQLMRGDGRAESRQVEVSEFSRSLKLLAKELKIPVLALSQLNRDSKGRKGGEPIISDLRESGSLEQDADVVFLLHRDEEHRAGQLKIIVAKNRHGRVGEVNLLWEGRFARAVSMPWSPTAMLN